MLWVPSIDCEDQLRSLDGTRLPGYPGKGRNIQPEENDPIPVPCSLLRTWPRASKPRGSEPGTRLRPLVESGSLPCARPRRVSSERIHVSDRGFLPALSSPGFRHQAAEQGTPPGGPQTSFKYSSCAEKIEHKACAGANLMT